MYNSSMLNIIPFEPVDYLMIGHITVDLSPNGSRLGGTATYSALTARAMGLRVGIVTSWGEEISSDPLNGIPIANFHTEKSSTFENILTAQGRVQYLYHNAPSIDYHLVPEVWRQAPIVHL